MNNNENIVSIVFIPISVNFWRYKINDLDFQEIYNREILKFTQHYIQGFTKQIQEYISYNTPFVLDLKNQAIFKLEYDTEINYNEVRTHFYKPENFISVDDSTNKKNTIDSFFNKTLKKIDSVIKNNKKGKK